MEPLMTAQDVMKFLQVGRSTLYAMLARGELPKPITVAKTAPRWEPEKLRAWVEARSEPTDQAA